MESGTDCHQVKSRWKNPAGSSAQVPGRCWLPPFNLLTAPSHKAVDGSIAAEMHDTGNFTYMRAVQEGTSAAAGSCRLGTAMTEAEWLACTDPMPMIEFLRGTASERKLRLFACACCRRIWPLLSDKHSRTALKIADPVEAAALAAGHFRQPVPSRDF